MKKIKSLKGFTLVECVVAMAILGIASLVMAQIYGSVAKINRENHRANQSLSQTVAAAEKQISSGAPDEVVRIHGDSITSLDMTFTKSNPPAHGTAGSYNIKNQDTDIYVYSAHYENNSGTSVYYNQPTSGSDPIGLRYKYFVYDPLP